MPGLPLLDGLLVVLCDEAAEHCRGDRAVIVAQVKAAFKLSVVATVQAVCRSCAAGEWLSPVIRTRQAVIAERRAANEAREAFKAEDRARALLEGPGGVPVDETPSTDDETPPIE